MLDLELQFRRIPEHLIRQPPMFIDQVLMLDPEAQLERILVQPAAFRRHIQVQTLHKAKDQVAHQMVDTRLEPELQFRHTPEHLTQQPPMFIMQFEAHLNCRRVYVWLDVIRLDPINRV